MGPPQGRAEGEENLPRPAAHTPRDAPQDPIGLLGTQGTLLAQGWPVVRVMPFKAGRARRVGALFSPRPSSLSSVALTDSVTGLSVFFFRSYTDALIHLLWPLHSQAINSWIKAATFAWAGVQLRVETEHLCKRRRGGKFIFLDSLLPMGYSYCLQNPALFLMGIAWLRCLGGPSPAAGSTAIK